MREFKARFIVPGQVEAEALVETKPISFLGDVDPRTGEIVGQHASKRGSSVAGKVFVFPHSRGSTVGSYVIYGLKRHGVAPAAIVNLESEPIVIVGCILANIPLVDKVSEEFFRYVRDGDIIELDPRSSVVRVFKR